MNDKNRQRHLAYEALVILGQLALLTYITRLWPILLLIILGIFIATLRLLFLSSKKVEPVKPLPALPPPTRLPSEMDMQSMAYSIIQRRITQILQEKYPDARWIWENPRAKEDILAGNPVYVLLSKAGGYRRGHDSAASGIRCGLRGRKAQDRNTCPQSYPHARSCTACASF